MRTDRSKPAATQRSTGAIPAVGERSYVKFLAEPRSSDSSKAQKWMDERTCGSMGGAGITFVQRWEDIPSRSFSLASHGRMSTIEERAFRRHIALNAACVECGSPLDDQTLDKFLIAALPERRYLICRCGCPAWLLDDDHDYRFERQLQRQFNTLRRQSRLREAGGSHSRSELQQLMELQKGRCIYCNRPFTNVLKQTRDHILGVQCGGDDTIHNLVLACLRCNARKGTTSFRSFCRALSPTQNTRIVKHLQERVRKMIEDEIEDEAFIRLDHALRIESRSILNSFLTLTSLPSAKRYAKVNRPVPTVIAILRAIRKEKR